MNFLYTEANADVSAAYFGVGQRKAAKAIRSMKFYNFLLRAPRSGKRSKRPSGASNGTIGFCRKEGNRPNA